MHFLEGETSISAWLFPPPPLSAPLTVRKPVRAKQRWRNRGEDSRGGETFQAIALDRPLAATLAANPRC